MTAGLHSYEFGTMPLPQRSDTSGASDMFQAQLEERMKNICDAIALHVNFVSPQSYLIGRMRLHFKNDITGKMWLLWCSDLSLDADPGPMRLPIMLLPEPVKVFEFSGRGTPYKATLRLTNGGARSAALPGREGEDDETPQKSPRWSSATKLPPAGGNRTHQKRRGTKKDMFYDYQDGSPGISGQHGSHSRGRTQTEHNSQRGALITRLPGIHSANTGGGGGAGGIRELTRRKNGTLRPKGAGMYMQRGTLQHPMH